jgi:hypothetical protein
MDVALTNQILNAAFACGMDHSRLDEDDGRGEVPTKDDEYQELVSFHSRVDH